MQFLHNFFSLKQELQTIDLGKIINNFTKNYKKNYPQESQEFYKIINKKSNLKN